MKDLISREYLLSLASAEGAYEYVSAEEIAKAPTVPAIPVSVIEEIKAEIEERKLKSGGEPNRELAFNVCLKIIDHHIKEYTE